jgi:membrane protease YdiL (CAAX protease family)
MSDDAAPPPEELPPLVTRAEPPFPKPLQPGFWLGVLLTFAYWIWLIGGMLVIVIAATFLTAAFGGREALKADPNAGSDVAKLPPALRTALAWSFPAGYFFGLAFTVIVLRIVVGRRWIRDIGLARVPPYHLLLGVLSLPGFIILSDALAKLVHPIDGVAHEALGINPLGDMGEALQAIFANLHWSIAVLAIGVGPGFVEELWCRGFLGRGFIGRYGWLPGIALSSSFFGMLHAWPPSYVITTAAMGACLHFAYVTSRSLWVPVAMHFANNSFAALAVLNLVPAEKIDAAIAANEAVVVALAAGVLLTCGLAMWQAKWSWPGERRGELVPPAGSEAKLQSATPNVLLFGLAAAACAGLVWMLAQG